GSPVYGKFADRLPHGIEIQRDSPKTCPVEELDFRANLTTLLPCSPDASSRPRWQDTDVCDFAGAENRRGSRRLPPAVNCFSFAGKTCLTRTRLSSAPVHFHSTYSLPVR